jgi:hypothetical protein
VSKLPQLNLTAPAVMSLKLQASSGDIKGLHIYKSHPLARHWWLTPVILATQEAEIRRIGFKASPDK